MLERAALLGGVAVGLGVALFGVDTVLTLGSSWDNLFLVPAGLVFACIPAIGYVIMSRTRMRAIGVDDRGVSFDLSSGKHIEIPWNDPHFALALEDQTKWPKRPYPHAPAYGIMARQFAGVYGYVPREVYDEVKRSAEAHGLWVDEREGSRGLRQNTYLTTHVEIRPFPRTAAGHS